MQKKWNHAGTKHTKARSRCVFSGEITRTIRLASAVPAHPRLMMLADEGKLSLDNPVEKFLPEFKGRMVAENGRAAAIFPRKRCGRRAPSRPARCR